MVRFRIETAIGLLSRTQKDLRAKNGPVEAPAEPCIYQHRDEKEECRSRQTQVECTFAGTV
jgi:hypothetical protein